MILKLNDIDTRLYSLMVRSFVLLERKLLCFLEEILPGCLGEGGI